MSKPTKEEIQTIKDYLETFGFALTDEGAAQQAHVLAMIRSGQIKADPITEGVAEQREQYVVDSDDPFAQQDYEGFW